MTSDAAAGLADFFERFYTFNPFLDNRINNPSARDVDVAEVHHAAFVRLTGLAQEALAVRRGVGAVLWGEAGVGKSHLLSRLARWAAENGRACFVYLHNLQAAPDRLPRVLLRSVLSLLTNGQAGRWHSTPLYDLLRAGLIGTVDGVSRWPSWDALHREYGRRLDQLGAADLPGAAPLDREVFEVLFQFFRSAYEMSRGREDGATAALSLRRLSGDGTAPAEAQQVKQVLTALSRLAVAAGRPFVLAFDQADNLDDEQFAALARFLEALIDASPNLLAVTAGVQASLLRWKESGVIQHSAWDRLAQFEVLLQRLTAGEALDLIRARLAEFFQPFADLGAIRERRRADPLFPLGEEWRRRYIGDKVDIRPRDAINWAREGWRGRQEVLGRRGGGDWLTEWKGSTQSEENGATPTDAEMRAAVDRAVGRVVEDHAAAVREERTLVPADPDRIAALVYELLTQCKEQAGLSAVRRLEGPSQGPPAPIDLEIEHSRPANGHMLRTGVLFLMVEHPNSATAYLRRLAEDAPPLDRLFLISDVRRSLRLGARGAELLRDVQQQPGRRFERADLSVADLADLDALQEAVRRARSGDLEAEVRPGQTRRVTEREVVESHHRRGRYEACRLLHDLLAAPAPSRAAEPAV